MFAGVIPIAVLAAAAVVEPVPPWAIESVPVIPGRGLVVNTLAAEAEPRLTSIEGFDVTPVPPLATGRVPLAIFPASRQGMSAETSLRNVPAPLLPLGAARTVLAVRDNVASYI